MQTTFEALLNADNTTRQQAETAIQRQYESAPMDLANALVANLNDKPEVATMCCVLMKKYFLDKRAQNQMGPAELMMLMQSVQNSIQTNTADQPLSLLKRKGEVLTRVYMMLNKSTELMCMVASLMQQQDAKMRQFAMYCFEVLAEVSMDAQELANMSKDLQSTFEMGLKDAENSVRVASLRAVTTFLSTIEDQDVVMKFVPVLNLIMDIIVEALKFDEESGRVGLEALGELTNAHAEIWKNPAKLLEITAEVMKHNKFEDGTRSAATEVLLALSSNMPAVLRKAEQMKTCVFPALATMLMEVEQDDATWESMEEDVDMVGKDPVATAMSSLMRLSEDLGAKTTIACTDQIIAELLQSQEWHKTQAGFVMIGVISAATKDSGDNYMKEKMGIFLNMQARSVRVEYSAFLAMGMIFTNWAPKVQKHTHQMFLPLLIQKMKAEQGKKMQTQVVSVILQFVQGLVVDPESREEEDFDSKAIIEPYIKELLQNLVILLKHGIQTGYEPLQTESLSLIHSICNVMLEDFGQYFNDFMPYMKDILTNVGQNTMAEKKLRAKAIETMGAIMIAVADCKDKTPYFEGIKDATNMIAQVLNNGLSDDDPQDEAIKSSLTSAASFLQKDFEPYMEFLTKHLLKDAQLEIDCKMENSDMPSQNEGFKVKVKGLGEQRVTVKTENLVKKVSAFSLIAQVSEGMGSAFAQYVPQMLPIVTAHMTYDFSTQIRKFALKTFVNILVAVGEEQNIALFQQAFPMFIEQITTKGLAKLDKKVTKTYLKYLAESLKALNRNNERNREFLSDAQIQSLGPIIKQTLDLTTALKQASIKVMQKQTMNQEIDEEDIERMKDDLAKVSKVGSQTMELTGQLVEIFKNRAFTTVRDNALGYFAKQLEAYKELTEDELLDTLCFFCDYVENTDANKDFASINQLAVKFNEIGNSDEDLPDFIMQTICYGFGVFAYNLPNGEFKCMKQAVEMCRQFVSGDDAFGEDRLVSTESTYGALAKIAYMHLDNKFVTNNDLAFVFSKMPFTGFDDENKNAHRCLIKQFAMPTSHVHNSSVKPAAIAALKRISEYQGAAKVLTAVDREAMMQLSL